eukprot:2816297-Alexandrium_andersonii.AAC.1
MTSVPSKEATESLRSATPAAARKWFRTAGVTAFVRMSAGLSTPATFSRMSSLSAVSFCRKANRTSKCLTRPTPKRRAMARPA